MAQSERVDALVIGSGYGGKWVAWHLAAAGQRAIVVERRYVGGSCPNINCLPSKNEITSAKVADVVRHASQFGTDVTSARINLSPSAVANPPRMAATVILMNSACRLQNVVASWRRARLIREIRKTQRGRKGNDPLFSA